MQTLVSDHTAAGGIAVCLSDSLVQSALALVGQTLGVRASEGQVQPYRTQKEMYARCSIRFSVPDSKKAMYTLAVSRAGPNASKL